MQNASNVTAAKPKKMGAVFWAPVGSTLPTDASAALDAAFKSLGYLSDDGVTNDNSPESESIKAWGGDVVLTINKGKEDTFAFTPIEATNSDVLAAVYGSDNVSGTLETGIALKVNADDAEPYAWVIDMILKGGALKRIVIPSAAVTKVGSIVYADGKTVGYPTTITATPDSDGQTHYEYIKAAASESK